MKKYKYFINIEKEEKWINSQIEKGYRLEKVSFFSGYTFRTVSEDDAVGNGIGTVKIDFRHFKNEDEKNEYLTFFEDCGWRKIISLSGMTGEVFYFEKVKAEASDDIFSDNESRAERYKRVLYDLGFVIGFDTICLIINRNMNKVFKIVLYPLYLILVISFIYSLYLYISSKDQSNNK